MLALAVALVIALLVIISGEACKDCDCADEELIARVNAELAAIQGRLGANDSEKLWSCVEYDENDTCLRGQLK
jgi:hypothetical protein